MTQQRFLKVVFAVCVAVLIIATIFFFRRRQILSHDYLGLGTYIHVQACLSPAKTKQINQAFDELSEEFKRIENDMSVYQSGSGVSRINASQGRAVVVSDELFYVLQESLRLSQITQGRFDMTVGPLITMWRDALKRGVLPALASIPSVKNQVGFQKMKLTQQNTVFLPEGMKIDLGGIAKGYAVDKAAQLLRNRGFDDFLIDAGGDIFASGLNCDGVEWRIGIRNPRDEGRMLAVIPVSDQAVTTSGDYEQFYEVDGKRWSHIIDPISGYPAHQAVSATVVAPSALEADALSTALSVFSAEEGEAVIQRLGSGYSALLVFSQNGREKQIRTKGFPDSL